MDPLFSYVMRQNAQCEYQQIRRRDQLKYFNIERDQMGLFNRAKTTTSFIHR